MSRRPFCRLLTFKTPRNILSWNDTVLPSPRTQVNIYPLDVVTLQSLRPGEFYDESIHLLKYHFFSIIAKLNKVSGLGAILPLGPSIVAFLEEILVIGISLDPFGVR